MRPIPEMESPQPASMMMMNRSHPPLSIPLKVSCRFAPAACALLIAVTGLLPPLEGARIAVSEPFEGVTHYRIHQEQPRRVAIHLLKIDPTAGGIGFFTTPSNGDLPGDTLHQTTRGFVTRHGLQIGINANFSNYVSYPHMNLLNIAASNGDVYSPFYAGWPGINITADNQVDLVTAVPGNISHEPPYFFSGFDPSPNVPLHNTVGGNELILHHGQVVATWADGLHPRTAAGVTADGKLLLFTVDGRNNEHSRGMSTTEVAHVLRQYGAVHGINLDGGGSTALVFADPSPRLVNIPVGVGDQPGTERNVGNNLGVFATMREKPLDFTYHFANFEHLPTVPTGSGEFFLRNPGFSGSTSGNLAPAPAFNDSIVVGPGMFPPGGGEGERALRLRWQFLPGLDQPWLRVSTHTSAAGMGQPVISFSKSVRLQIYSTQDLRVLLLVRNTASTGDYGSTGTAAGGFEFIGGPGDSDGQIMTLPPRGKGVRAGRWNTLYFDLRNDSVTGWNVNNPGLNGNGLLETPRGIIQALVFQPVRWEDGGYSTAPATVFLRDFQVTEDRPGAERPRVNLLREEAGRPAGLSIEGAAFAEHRVEVSPDLGEWSPAATVETDRNGLAVFHDPPAANLPRRFYRIR